MSPTSCQTAPPRARENQLTEPKIIARAGKGCQRFTTKNPGFARSVDRGAARLDDAGPFYRFGADPAREFRGRAGYHVEALLAEQAAHLGRPHDAHCFRDR